MKNREIKFRGQRTDNKEWVYGYYVIDPSGLHRIYYRPFDSATSNTYHFVNPETVGQFTGLGAKDETEIYDGDILSDGDTLFMIEWNAQNTGYWLMAVKNLTKDGDDFMFYMNSQVLGNGYYTRKDLWIIGNIYENPDLCK